MLFLLGAFLIRTVQAASADQHSPQESIGHETTSPNQISPRDIELLEPFLLTLFTLLNKETWNKEDFEQFLTKVRPHKKELQNKKIISLLEINLDNCTFTVSIFNNQQKDTLTPIYPNRYTLTFKTDQNFKMWLKSHGLHIN